MRTSTTPTCRKPAAAIALVVAMAAFPGCASQRPAAPEPARPATGIAWPTFQLRPDHNAVIPREHFTADWTFDTHARINGGLAIAGDTLYFDTFAPSVGALDVTDGAPKWQVPVDNIVMSTPIVANDTIYIGTGSNHQMAGMTWGRPEGDRVLALDAADGRQRWTYKTTGEDMPSPVYIRGTLVFANGDAHAYGLNAATGRQMWRQALEGVSTMASATADGTRALVSTCTMNPKPGGTVSFDARTGAVRWKSRYGNCDSAPTVAGKRAFLSGIDLERTRYGFGYRATVAAVDTESGKPAWVYRSSELGIASSQVASSERAIAGTYADGTYYQAVPTHARLMAFDAAAGKVRWSMKTLGPVKMSPVVRNGYLYFGDIVGCLYTVDAAHGTLVSIRTFNEPFSVSPPIIVGDTLIVAIGTKIRAFPLRGASPR